MGDETNWYVIIYVLFNKLYAVQNYFMHFLYTRMSYIKHIIKYLQFSDFSFSFCFVKIRLENTTN